ncbi:MAG: peptide chain release factor N(5)-glutamine methyltransferase [Chloroflexota bacterium]|nr:peptide chain release factor N(5)-glutamine methyltransferase [Chloroflexota bacterium]
MITSKEALEQGILVLLNQPGQETPRLDAQVLLSHVLGVERPMLYAYPERALSREQEERFRALIARRAQGEPIAYLTGHKEFYGLDLLVDRRVLIPRPETELLVESALAVIRRMYDAGRLPMVADIGTGSGAIPVALAVHEPRLSFLYACDIAPAALAVARLNCQRHHVASRVRLLQGDLLDPLPEPVDVLVANLPYVGLDEMTLLAPDVRAFEPHLALFSGSDGLDLLRRLFVDAHRLSLLKPGAIVCLEIGYQQREPLVDLLHELWPQAQATFTQDYSGWDRLLQVSVP